jgi:predicted acyl esterase
MASEPKVELIYPPELVRSPVPPPGAVLDENVRVAMRDGITLAADVYRPETPGRYPVLFSLSPYSKDIQQQPPQFSHAIESGATGFYVAHGYVHVIAQGRGCGRSQGQWRWFEEHERTDGYDMIEWIAQQPWCDGNVGMIGDSYWTWSQYAAASAQPPHLKCICLCDGTTDMYRDACYPGGIFNASFINHWIAYHTAMAAWPGPVDGKQPPMNLHWEIVNRPYDSDWWQGRSARSQLERIKVPMMSIAPQGGQMHFRGQLAGYPQIDAPKKLLVVPPTGFWSHLRYLTNRPLNLQMLRWFDHWLKGKDTGLMDEPEVAIFDSGTRAWRYESEYPLARTQWTSLYLGAGHLIGAAAPTADEAPDTYRMPDSYAQLIAGKPVLAYATAPLTQPLKLGGPMSLTLFASSSQIDTAWFVNVLDVNPDGKAAPLSRGMLRASFRALDAERSKPGQPFHPFTKSDLLEPGTVYEFQIELRPVFHTIKLGHRLQLTIASDDIQFNNPLRQIDVQLLPWPVENAVHHSAAHPSHLVLPVIPDAAEIQAVGAPLAQIDWPMVPGQWMPDTEGHPLRR